VTQYIAAHLFVSGTRKKYVGAC